MTELFRPRTLVEMIADMRPFAGGADEDDKDESDKDESDKDASDKPDPDDAGDKDDSDKDETDFKAEAAKWRTLSRKHERNAKANADAAKRLKDVEDADKSEQQKLADKVSDAEARAAKAEVKAARYEIAQDKEIPAKFVRFLTGSTTEEIEESADELLGALEELKSPDKEDTGDKPKPGTKPKERLKPGATSDDEPDADTTEIAERILKRERGF